MADYLDFSTARLGDNTGTATMSPSFTATSYAVGLDAPPMDVSTYMNKLEDYDTLADKISAWSAGYAAKWGDPFDGIKTNQPTKSVSATTGIPTWVKYTAMAAIAVGVIVVIKESIK